jgi:hypothetical protein
MTITSVLCQRRVNTHCDHISVIETRDKNKKRGHELKQGLVRLAAHCFRKRPAARALFSPSYHTQQFQQDIKVQGYCLTGTIEAFAIDEKNRKYGRHHKRQTPPLSATMRVLSEEAIDTAFNRPILA